MNFGEHNYYYSRILKLITFYYTDKLTSNIEQFYNIIYIPLPICETFTIKPKHINIQRLQAECQLHQNSVHR